MYGVKGVKTRQVRAVYDFEGQAEGDLGFAKGAIITLISTESKSGPDWWYGEVGGMRGSFPINHVEELQQEIRQADMKAGNGNSFSPKNAYKPPQPKYSPPVATYNQQNTYNPPQYNTPSYTNSYTPPSSGMSGYNVNETVEQTTPKTSSFRNGGGAEDNLYKGMVWASCIYLFLNLVSLIFPWYSTANGVTSTIWHWTGIAVIQGQTVGVAAMPPSQLINWQAESYPNVASVFNCTLAFMILGFLSGSVLAILAHLHRIGKFQNAIALLVAALCTFVFSCIGFLQFFRFETAYLADVDTTCTVGPCTSFNGSTGNDSWGPGIGWIVGLFSFLDSFAILVIGLHIFRLES